MTLISRRRFIEAACWAGVSSAIMPKVSYAGVPGDKRLVFVLLRGAMDGLHAFVPVGDPWYLRSRRSMAFNPADLAVLDDFFALGPGLSALLPSYQAGELLVVHGLAIPYRTRSHFDAQSILETGLDRPIGKASGWLNRSLLALGGQKGMGLALGHGRPKSMAGEASVSTWSPGEDLGGDREFHGLLAQLYLRDSSLADSYTAAQNLRATARNKTRSRLRGRRADYVNLFQSMAGFLSAPEGPRIAAMEFSGWDTHVDQGLAGGPLDLRLADLAAGLVAFKDDLPSDVWRDTVVVVATEFGRTVAANGNGGTDHGTGGAMMLFGGGVKGGRVLSDWPGLAPGQLYEDRDLRPTLDTRQILKGVLAAQFDISPSVLNRQVFPDSQGLDYVQGLLA